jgi:hypothetical protein
MTVVTPPTEAEWLSVFVRGQMGVPTSALPDGSVYIDWAYGAATEIVNMQLQCVSPLNYKLAVYNLAASNLLNFAQDVPQEVEFPGAPVAPGYFATIRQTLGLNNFTIGLVSSASDEGTSTAYAIPDYIKTLSLADLVYLQNPYGRIYFSIAQRYTTVWGIN